MQGNEKLYRMIFKIFENKKIDPGIYYTVHDESENSSF